MSASDDEYEAARAAVEKATAEEHVADLAYEALTDRWRKSGREADTPSMSEFDKWRAARKRTDDAWAEVHRLLDARHAK